jgi:hypothetical protein
MYENDVVSPILFFPPCHSENERLRREDEESRGVDESISSFSKREGTSPSLELEKLDEILRCAQDDRSASNLIREWRIAERAFSSFLNRRRGRRLK